MSGLCLSCVRHAEEMIKRCPVAATAGYSAPRLPWVCTTDERERQLERASEIVASSPNDDPPMSVVIDAGLAHLIQSEENIREARKELNPETIQRFNTDVIGLRYRTTIESRWR